MVVSAAVNLERLVTYSFCAEVNPLYAVRAACTAAWLATVRVEGKAAIWSCTILAAALSASTFSKLAILDSAEVSLERLVTYPCCAEVKPLYALRAASTVDL